MPEVLQGKQGLAVIGSSGAGKTYFQQRFANEQPSEALGVL